MIAALLLDIIAEPGQEQNAFEVAPGIYQVARATAFAHHRDRLYFGTRDGHIYSLSLWNVPPASVEDVQLGTFDRLYDHDRGISALSTSSDGEWLAATEATGDQYDGVLLFALGRDNVPRKFASVGLSGGLVFEPDRKHALTEGMEYGDQKWLQQKSLRHDLETGQQAELTESERQAAVREVGIGAVGRFNSQYLFPSWNSETKSVDLIGHRDNKTHGSLLRSSVFVRLLERWNHVSWAGMRAAVRSEDRKTINVFSLVDASLKASITVPSGVWCQEFWMLGEDLLLTNSVAGTQFWDLDNERPVLTLRMYFDGLTSWILVWDEQGRYYAEPALPTRLPMPEGAIRQDAQAIGAAWQKVMKRMTEPRLHNDFLLPLVEVLPPQNQPPASSRATHDLRPGQERLASKQSGYGTSMRGSAWPTGHWLSPMPIPVGLCSQTCFGFGRVRQRTRVPSRCNL
jgi:hypothetical protein